MASHTFFAGLAIDRARRNQSPAHAAFGDSSMQNAVCVTLPDAESLSRPRTSLSRTGGELKAADAGLAINELASAFSRWGGRHG